MPAVFAVLSTVVGAITGAIGSVVSVIGGVLGSITGFIGGILEPIIGAISTGLNTLLGPIITPINQLTGILQGSILDPINLLAGQLLQPILGINQGISSGISALQSQENDLTRPIITPMIDTLAGIQDYIQVANNDIIDGLEPVTEATQLVQSLTSIKMATQLLEGTESLAQGIGWVAETAGLDTAHVITELWSNTVGSITGVMGAMDERYEYTSERIDEVVATVEAQESVNVAELETKIDTAVINVTANMDERATALEAEVTTAMDVLVTETDTKITTLEEVVATAERRTQDLPWFMEMMSRALG